MLYSHVMPKKRPGAGGGDNSIELFAKFKGETVEAFFFNGGTFSRAFAVMSS